LLFGIRDSFSICRTWGNASYTPQSQLRTFTENGNPGSGGDTGQGFLCARFPVSEAIAADHDGNETCDLRNRAREKALYGGKARVER
jgi:hypothetical protein